jgi:hypothetical protein
MKKIILVEFVKRVADNKTIFWYLYNAEDIACTFGYKTIFIMYPKGQRPDLPYPQNKKELC